jgi:hypothetical protein
MNRAGSLLATVDLPASGAWELWLQGQFMPAVTVSVDGRRVLTAAGQLSGNSRVPNTLPPLRLALSAGRHTLTATRFHVSLAPGERGAAVLAGIVLTRVTNAPSVPLTVAVGDWHALCGRRWQWVELVSA